MNIKSYLSIIFITLVSLLLITTKTFGVIWKTEVVDSGGGVGGYTSVAIDSSDNVHIGYYNIINQDLKYATDFTGSWVTETVDSGTAGAYTSIAIDSSDNVHISYLGFTIVGLGINNLHLKYATNFTGLWVTETVDSSGSAGLYTSIAIDSSNKVHISYYDAFPNEDLKYATNVSGSWITETVDSSGGLHTSIGIDPSGNVHISYWSEEQLKYATNTTGLWVTETLDSDEYVGYFTSIALDSSGKVHISYSDIYNNLKYATNATGSWITETVDKASGYSAGTWTSVALDSSDKVHISYLDGTNRDLKYATTNVLVPDIKVNGSDGPVTLADNLLVTVALDSGSLSGDNADWWVAADTPYGWFYLVASTMSWEFAGTSYTDLLVTHQGALFNLSTIEVLNIPVAGLLPGTYTLYFAVDTNMNGSLDFDSLYYDSVVVNIEP